MLCVKKIGEQLAEFMTEEGMKAPAVAEKCGTSRQNIEGLLANPERQPKYLPKLAALMGTTVDTLLQGRYRHPKNRPAGAPAANPESWPLAPYVREEDWRAAGIEQRKAAALAAAKVLSGNQEPVVLELVEPPKRRTGSIQSKAQDPVWRMAELMVAASKLTDVGWKRVLTVAQSNAKVTAPS